MKGGKVAVSDGDTGKIEKKEREKCITEQKRRRGWRIETERREGDMGEKGRS